MNRSYGFGLVVLALILSVVPSAAIAAAPSYTCTGGIIPAGIYGALIIDGACNIPDGVVLVQHGLTVKSGAVLDAKSTAAHVDVKGGVYVGSDAVLVFGCSPSLCEDTTGYTVSGGVVADHPLAVVFHGNTIKGGVSVTGGGGGLSCEPNPAMPSPFPFPLPLYSDFENNAISGSVTVSGLQSCWLGFIRNHVSGTVTFTDNDLLDPDAIEIVTNTVRGNLVCSGNSDVLFGDSEGEPNEVTGRKTGQCSGL